MPTNDETYFNLGAYTRKVTSSTEDGQNWFDRGMVWTMGYCHEEAIKCFEKALELEDLPMAHWGIAYCVGPNYNLPWDMLQEEQKVGILTSAADHLKKINLDGLTPVEQDIIQAASSRYPSPETDEWGECIHCFDKFHDSYAREIREVYAKHPKDLDVNFLMAEALMVRTPWKLWDFRTKAATDGADTGEVVRVLENAFETLDGAWEHPGLLHMYVHLLEMSSQPEKALRHGDILRHLVPDSGHLIHMPTHIDVLCGDYVNVVSRNSEAIVADREFVKRSGINNFYALYRVHNYHFKIYGAMFLGQPSAALETAEELIENVPRPVVEALENWVEGFVSMKQHVLVRFGMWKDIIDQDLPEDDKLYVVTTAVMRYARTVAMANMNDMEGAEIERKLFLEAKEKVPKTRYIHNNTCCDILDVAELMLEGEYAYRRGEYDQAFEFLREAVKKEDNLPYDEPWGWMTPVRHALGALLLEQGHYDEAEVVYREDLGLVRSINRSCQHPQNVWALHGLYECLQHRGESVESIHIKQQLDRAVARAEVPINASCFCRSKVKC